LRTLQGQSIIAFATGRLEHDIPDYIGQLSIRRQMKFGIFGKPSVHIGDIFRLDTRWQAMCFAMTKEDRRCKILANANDRKKVDNVLMVGA
jgi:hypothetical protein